MLSFSKQPAEKYPIGIDFKKTLAAGETIGSAQAYARRIERVDSSLSALANSGASTITLSVNVQAGAKVVLNPRKPNAEEVMVTDVAGVGPYTATIVPPLAYDHVSDEPISYEPGAPEVLNGAPTVDGTVVLVKTQGGVAGEHYGITVLATISAAVVLEEDVLMRVEAL